MDIGRIKNKRVGLLEQSCERYAIMVFEKLNGRLAIGLRSITRSYEDHEYYENQGTFTALFKPWSISGNLKREDRIVELQFGIIARDDGQWKLHGGFATVEGEEALYTLVWSKDGTDMICFLPGEADDLDLENYKGSIII